LKWDKDMMTMGETLRKKKMKKPEEERDYKENTKI
jgi:hypothetical protein